MMETTLQERVLLLSIMPSQGNFNDLVIGRDLTEKIQVTQDEILLYNIEQKDGGLTWKQNEDSFKYDLTDLETGLIKKLLTKLNTEDKLPIELIDVYKQIV